MDQGWIKVSDTLPRRGQKIIAWAADGKDQVKNLMQEVHFSGDDYIYGFHNNSMRGVTHWMPFPDPPEPEEE